MYRATKYVQTKNIGMVWSCDHIEGDNQTMPTGNVEGKPQCGRSLESVDLQ